MQDLDAKTAIALLNQKLDYAITEIAKLSVLMKEVVDGGAARQAGIAELRACLRDFEEVEKKVRFMFPWVSGLRWFALILGGALALALIAGLLWAVAQSGAWLP